MDGRKKRRNQTVIISKKKKKEDMTKTSKPVMKLFLLAIYLISFVLF